MKAHPDPIIAFGDLEDIVIVQTIRGKVTDDSGVGLPGVNVLEKGTTNGTTTDVDGGFTLNVLNENSVLVFSFIGFVTQDVSVGTQTQLNVSS